MPKAFLTPTLDIAGAHDTWLDEPLGDRCPGAVDVRCSCGWYANTVWGNKHAEMLRRSHLWKVGMVKALD